MNIHQYFRGRQRVRGGGRFYLPKVMPLAASFCLLLTHLHVFVFAIETDQIDDFNTGGVNGWGGGTSVVGTSPTVRTDGGADGPADGFLEIRREGFLPYHLGTRNMTRWAGDYLANNIKAIEMDFNRFDLRTSNLRFRLLIFGPGGTFATKSQTPPLAVNHWEHYVFGLSANDLVYVENTVNPLGGVNDLEQTLSNVTTLLIRNDAIEPALPGDHPPHVLATVGIDNIHAISSESPLDVFIGTDIAGFPGWKASPWYLNYNIDFWPWIFHDEHSWQFVIVGSASDAIFLFDLGLGEIIFLNQNTYRWIYLFGEAPGWIFTFADNSPDRRFFQRGDDGSLFSVPAGLPAE